MISFRNALHLPALVLTLGLFGLGSTSLQAQTALVSTVESYQLPCYLLALDSANTAAQPFVTSSTAWVVSEIDLSLLWAPVGINAVQISIYDDANGHPGNALFSFDYFSTTNGNQQRFQPAGGTGSNPVVLAANTKYWVVGTSTGTFLENGGNGWCGQAGLTATGVGTLPSEAAATYYSGTWYAAEKTQFFAVYGTISTPATLSTFTATPGATQVDLAWSTASEVATSGFNIWRSDAADGTYTKLNAALIPATGVSPAGASYTWSDTSLSYNYAVFYKLEDIDANGLSNLHGPVSATEVTNTLRTFQASPASIFLGGGSTLSWTVIGSPTLTLDGTAVSGTSSWVTPTANKTYSLSDGQSSQTATVSVRTFAFTDMAALSRVWGSVKGDATYNACYDLNGDGKVDDADVDLSFTGF